MIPAAYYNGIDPYAAEWLRNLIAAGHIAPVRTYMGVANG